MCIVCIACIVCIVCTVCIVRSVYVTVRCAVCRVPCAVCSVLTEDEVTSSEFVLVDEKIELPKNIIKGMMTNDYMLLAYCLPPTLEGGTKMVYTVGRDSTRVQ